MHRVIVLWLARCAIVLIACLPSGVVAAQTPSDTPAAAVLLQARMEVVGQSRCRLTDDVTWERLSVRIDIKNESGTAARVVPLDFLAARIWTRGRELTGPPDIVVSPHAWFVDDWVKSQARIDIQQGESASVVLPLDVTTKRAGSTVEGGLAAGDYVGIVVVQLFVEVDGADGRWQRMEAPLNMRIPEPPPTEELAEC